MICWSSAGLMLVHRLRRWPNIKPALDKRPVFAGKGFHSHAQCRSPTHLKPACPPSHACTDESVKVSNVTTYTDTSITCVSVRESCVSVTNTWIPTKLEMYNSHLITCIGQDLVQWWANVCDVDPPLNQLWSSGWAMMSRTQLAVTDQLQYTSCCTI